MTTYRDATTMEREGMYNPPMIYYAKGGWFM
jgi:hypothetical protein